MLFLSKRLEEKTMKTCRDYNTKLIQERKERRKKLENENTTE